MPCQAMLALSPVGDRGPVVDAVTVYADADAAALYDVLNPWNGTRYPSDAFYLDLATMTGHAFQCLVGDEELRASLTAIRAALREGGRFAFETRHPQARAWEDWNPSNASEVVDLAGRRLRVWHQVEEVAGDVVTFTEATGDPDGTVLRVDRASLRFLGVPALRAFLAGAGLAIEAQYGDWHRGPVTDASREIITIARRI
jgi:hypothetical protein